MVPVQSTGGRTTTNRINIRIKAFYANKLNSILKVKRKSIKCNSFYAIIIQFLNKNVRIITFKRFLKIKKYNARKISFVWLFSNFISQVNKSMRGWALLSKYKLQTIYLWKRLYLILSRTLSMFDNRDLDR